MRARKTRGRGLPVALLVALAAACSHGRPAQVSDADFGRLSAQQTGPVDRARQEQQTAREELGRAKLGLEQAQHELQMAEAEETAAKATAQRAKAVADAAKESRAPAALQRAARLGDEAKLHERSADAHVEWARKLIEARHSGVEAAQRHLDLAQAQVNYARLDALQQANIPAATKYDASEFQGRVDDARKRLADAQQAMHQREAEAATARDAYRSAHQQLQAHQGTYPGTTGQEPSGTGSSR